MMNSLTRLCVFLASALCFCGGVFSQERVGVAIAPRMGDGDDTEQLIYKYLAGRPDIDHIFVPDNVPAFFEVLKKVEQSGKLIDRLIIAGHGSRENPSIELKKDSLMPGDVDLVKLCQHRERYREIRRSNMARGRDTTVADREIAEAEARMKTLLSLPAVMAANAEVVLLNCSSFATPTGQTFVNNLGKHLLSLRGGTIRASRNDVGIGQVEDLADWFYGRISRNQDQDIGDFWVRGDWIVIPIAGSGSLATEPKCPPPSKSEFTRLVLYEHGFEVFDPGTRTFVEGQKMTTPTSNWFIDQGAFRFASRKDGFQLNVYWDQMPPMVDPLVSFPFSVFASLSGPRKAQVAVTPSMNMTGWHIETADAGSDVDNPGVNAFRINMNGLEAENKKDSSFMKLNITAVGYGADVIEGEVVGGNGKVFAHEKPGEFDVFFLELNCNGLAKIRWAFVPEGSPYLDKKREN